MPDQQNVNAAPPRTLPLPTRVLAQIAAAALLGAIAVLPDVPSPVRPAAAAEAVRVDSAERAVRRIRAHYQTIQRELATYRCRTLGLDGFSAEGGELTACAAPNGELRKMTAVFYGESGRGRNEFFLWGGQLEFVYSRDERYTRPLSGVVRHAEEQRYYFDGGRLVRWLGPGNAPRAVVGGDADRLAASYLADARKLAACAADGSRESCEAE